MSTDMELLRARLGEISDVTAAIALLDWDQQTYMPPKAADGRGRQLATLAAMAHRLMTGEEVGGLLARLAGESLPPEDAKLVEVARYDQERARKVPGSLVEAFAEAQSQAFQAWIKARERADFAVFAPHLERLLELLRRRADCLGYDESPYDALLEDYERGISTGPLRTLFAHLAEEQRRIVSQIAERGNDPAPAWLDEPWDEQAQWRFTLRVLGDMGYDMEAGRQDRSVHPFTTSMGIRDVRITTRTDSRQPFSALLSSIHEGGHALYEQGLADADARTPLASGTSLGMHESQSRLWENGIGRSLPFWRHYLPVLREYFPVLLHDATPEDVYRAINRVEPSLIRVEADECTYNLHIILRFELEVELLEGRLAVRDVPEAWNARFQQYLGIGVPDDAHGCLQDIHWSHGLFGYFPTYALGNLYAAQLLEVIEDQLPGLWAGIAEGRFQPLREWLRDRVHRHGRRKTARELIADITGGEPDAGPYIRYLKKKFGAIYG